MSEKKKSDMEVLSMGLEIHPVARVIRDGYLAHRAAQEAQSKPEKPKQEKQPFAARSAAKEIQKRKKRNQEAGK